MSERTPQEREAARLERERKRGKIVTEPAAPLQLDPEPVPVDFEPLEPEPIAFEPLDAESVEPEPAEPEPAAPEPAAPEPIEPEPIHSTPPPPRLPDVAATHRPAPEAVVPVAAPPTFEPHDDHDVPIGTVRPGAGAAGMPRQPVSVPGRRHRRRRKPGRVAVMVALIGLLVALVGFFAFKTFNPGTGEGGGTVVIKVPTGAGTRQIGDLLADKGVVGSGFFFSLRAKLGGDTIRPGIYTLKHDMSNGAALDALTPAVKPVAPTIKVLVPEGPSRRQLGPIVAKQGVQGDYVAASRRSAELNPRTYGAPKGASLEGFLFPATYDLARGAQARTLVSRQLQAFKDNTAGISWAYAKRKNLTKFDVLTLASIIEREAQLNRDRRLVAAVFYNRLKQGIALGSDATTRFAVNNWTRPLKVSQLRSSSRYNTRRFRGLPPGPIGNPGLSAIKAAANPAKSAALFFIVKACGKGALAFSRTDAQFQKDVAAYNAARARNGGSDPKVCK